jgi:DNA-binding GntR family transcriptional regulator
VSEALRRVSVVDELAAVLREQILDGRLEPGAALREQELSDRYDVSRHTLRAALRALAGEGIVELEPNRGARVPVLDRVALTELFELRTALELEAAHLALQRSGGRLPRDVHAALATLVGRCGLKSPRWHDVARAHEAFHNALVASSQSPRIVRAYGPLAGELRLFLVQLRPTWPLARMAPHHTELVARLEAGDLPALRAHLADGLEAVTGAGE